MPDQIDFVIPCNSFIGIFLCRPRFDGLRLGDILCLDVAGIAVRRHDFAPVVQIFQIQQGVTLLYIRKNQTLDAAFLAHLRGV